MSKQEELKLEKEVISFIKKAMVINEEQELENLFTEVDNHITTPLININVKILNIINESGFFNSLLFPIGGDNAVSLMYELIKVKKFDEFLYFYQKSQYPNYWFRYNRDENDNAVKSFRVKDLMIATIRLLDQNKGFCLNDMLKKLSINDILIFSESLNNSSKHFDLIAFFKSNEFEKRFASEKELEFIEEKYQHTHEDLKNIIYHFTKEVEKFFLIENEDIISEIQNSMANIYNK